MQGRKPRGPEIVREFEGDAQARERLERILDTVAGRLGVNEAADQLGITPQRLHMLREEALQAALDALAPQPLGRPTKSAASDREKIDALQQENERLQRELAASKLREEIALVLPDRPRRGEKKGAPTPPPECASVPEDGVTASLLNALSLPTETPAMALPLESSLPIEIAIAPAAIVPTEACPAVESTPVATATTTAPLPLPAVTPVLGVRVPDEQVHRERLRPTMTGRARSRRAKRRDPAWQGEQRQREQSIRADAAKLASAWKDQGVPAQEIADLLDCPPRTLRHWQQQLLANRLQPTPLGRPHLHCTVEESQEVIRFLHGHGPWVGMPTLSGAFCGLPAAELRDLLGIFRHLWIAEHPRECAVLHWHQVGTVWAMDFTKVNHPIDGLYPYVFAVRDLASGQQLAWRPVLDMTAATAQTELDVLFTIHGAPLVLKSDNGSAFLADSTKNKLVPWQVWPLYSPPGQPGYNGAIEASIGSLKKRTQHAAYLAGHAGQWTTADLDRARELANFVARPRGAEGPTPRELWASRRPPTLADREAFDACTPSRNDCRLLT